VYFSNEDFEKYIKSKPSSADFIALKNAEQKSAVIKKWGYELIAVPYLNRIDGKIHRYFPDYYCEILDNSGSLKKCIVEVKPFKQQFPPAKPKNNNRKAQVRYLNEVSTYIVNQCKWDACKDMCNKNGFEFVVLNEKQIF
jgi:hypothetical protein